MSAPEGPRGVIGPVGSAGGDGARGYTPPPVQDKYKMLTLSKKTLRKLKVNQMTIDNKSTSLRRKWR